MPKPKLENTCLCAIVRDEEINPAGGIADFLECTLPYVGSAVVVDTGSKDKTRQILRDFQSKYPSLTVLDSPFRGYAEARNLSLSKSPRAGYTIVLDADERLFEEDFQKIEVILSQKPLGINLKSHDIYPEGDEFLTTPHNPRIFMLNQGFVYSNRCGLYNEILVEEKELKRGYTKLVDTNPRIISSNIVIKHFRPRVQALRVKQFWYELLSNITASRLPQNMYSQICGELNPQRLNWPMGKSQ
jgi:glycosyltransferase involved in cell wall biosynthesis